MFRHPFNGRDVPLVNLQQGDRTPTPQPSMARPSKAPKSVAASQASRLSSPDEDMDPELWYACAGPQHTLPPVHSLVAYFPQGHIEQVASFNNPDAEGHIPRYNLPAAIPCTLNDIRLSADPDTDEVFATLTLCPVSPPTEESMFSLEPLTRPKQKSISFTKTLTASDTSTHGGFSVPRRGAEDCFPPLDKSQDNPVQDLVAKDLHGNEWKFKHLFRGQPKRHLLTTGWSVFVSQKRLVAGDAVLFLRDEDGQLRIAVRLAPRQQKQQSIMVTTPTMAIGVLEAAAHAASENSRFSLIYNPRSCPSQFVIPYSKYVNASKKNFTVGQRIKSEFSIYDSKSLTAVKSSPTLAQRSRARFESEDLSDCRYTGTITEISDYDHVRWPESAWRSIQVKWDETCSERQERISPWEISPFTARLSLPLQDRTRKRYKAPTQLHTVQHSPAMNKAPVTHFRRPDPAPGFGVLPVPGLQDLFGSRCMDVQEEAVNFGMQVYRTYKANCDGGSSLQPHSPRPAALHSYVKSEPFSDADLQLRVSCPVANDQAGVKFGCSQQPSLASLRDSPGWIPSPRPQPDTICPPSLGGLDCTVLSMSNLPPRESENSSHPSAVNSNFWENQIQTTPSVPDRCRIFGVSLDRPAIPPVSRDKSAAKVTGSLTEVPTHELSCRAQ